MSAPKKQKKEEEKKWESVVSIKQYTRADVDTIFRVATEMRGIVEEKGACDLCYGKVLANVFYEPSTRTSSSFYAAMLRLGGTVVPVSASNSSVKKGETLEDTVRCLEQYCDVIVLRHPEIGSAARAAKVLSCPLLNAGDGAGEHPTQAFLDAFTMHNELGKIDGLTITMVGDLKYGRTVHSLSRLLSLFSNVTLNYVSPEFLQLPSGIQDEVKSNGASNGVSQHTHTELSGVLSSTDILYVTRVQKERFEDPKEYEKAAGLYIITPELLEKHNAKSTLRILHPLPRVNELSPDLDSDPRAAYFREMKCGLYVRMALLALVLGKIQ